MFLTRILSRFLQFLGLERGPARVGLRPRRDVELALGADAAYERVLDAMERVLGANVYVNDRASAVIEAGFGLVNNERVRASIEARGTAASLVRVEALFRAGVEIPETSRAVDALASALQRDAVSSGA